MLVFNSWYVFIIVKTEDDKEKSSLLTATARKKVWASQIEHNGGRGALLKAIKKNKAKEPRRNFKKCMSVCGVITITYTSVCIAFKRTQC